MRPLIRLQPKQDRRLESGHPWAFSELATTPEHRAWPPGSIVRIEGDDGWRHGAFMFNPRSLIAARLLDRDPGASVNEASVNEAWVRARLADAIALRARVIPARTTASFMPRPTGCLAWSWTASVTWPSRRPTPPAWTACCRRSPQPC